MRTAGKRGRHPAKRLAMKFVHEYAAVPLPAPSYPVDVSAGITDWGMLGNDHYGDCTFAGREHYRRAKAAAGHESGQWETTDHLVAEYLAYDHGVDQGAVIADLLMAWYRDGKILAFAPVDHTDPELMDAAMQAFHGLYAGVNLTADADQLFGEGQPWTVAEGETPDPAEGHCIVKVGADGHQYDTWVTWGALQRSTLEWSAACLDEAWVIITGEDARAASLDMDALVADIKALGGTGPQVNPAKGTPAHPAVLTELISDLEQVIAKAKAWIHILGS